MTILLEAVEAGSLSAAGAAPAYSACHGEPPGFRAGGPSQDPVTDSRQPQVVLTDAGRDYVASCRRILEDISEAERNASGEYRAPQGELVISAPVSLGRTHILPILVKFLSAYPDIKMQLTQTDRAVNLLEENVDLAVRLGFLPGQQPHRNPRRLGPPRALRVTAIP